MTPGPGIYRTKLPQGFLAGGINCGVRRYRPDLGVILSTIPSVAVGVFTQNTCKAAPVRYCQHLLPAENIRAIITNSGQANAATGAQGEQDNQSMANALAAQLKCQPEQILTASTGVIGEALAINKITQAIPTLVESVSDIAEKFATAILTTDLVPKTVSKTVQLSQGRVHITGVCKGSGMIHPNMATMLGYILTDADLTSDQAQTLLSTANADSFNMISVDGETSTNDSVFMLANGASKVAVHDAKDEAILQTAINEIAIVLAKSIARDGEGASKLIQVSVKGAPTRDSAKTMARSLTISPLIKTAVYGESPNWGRILSRLGMQAMPEDTLANCQIQFQGITIFSQGTQQTFASAELSRKMKQDTIHIDIDLAAGCEQAVAWGCDLTEGYVKINAEYVT